MFWRMWIRPFDLNETFRANGLITTPRPIKIWRIVQKANRAFRCVLVEVCFERLSVDFWLARKHCFSRLHVLL